MPNSIRATDCSNVPALQRRPRSLSRATRRLLIAYGVCLALSFAGLIWLALEIRHEGQVRDRAIQRELDRRTAARTAQNEGTRDALCGVLRVDLKDSPNAQRLARDFDCP